MHLPAAGGLRCNWIQLVFSSVFRRQFFVATIGGPPLIAAPARAAEGPVTCIRDMAMKNAQREPRMHAM